MTTSPTIIDGKAAAARMIADLAADISALTIAGHKPGLAVILVGDHPASEIYVRNKITACAKNGIESFKYHLPATTQQADVETLIHRLNADRNVHGILLQLPLPVHLDSTSLIDIIAPEKDVDGLHPLNIGRLVAGQPGIIPCTPSGALHLLKSVKTDLGGLHAAVLGRSLLFGKPMGQILLHENCTVTQAHSRSINLPALCRQADILIAATGQAGMVKGDWIKPGAIVIDVGITRRDDGKLVGDVDYESAIKAASAITPVPGGVGPMTIAYLLANTVKAAKHFS